MIATFRPYSNSMRRKLAPNTSASLDRLEALGGSASPAKSLLAHIFSMTPKTASIGHEAEERTTQNLLIAYAVENSEVAMYESLAATAEAAGDTETASLARSIQVEEKATAEKIWALIPAAASAALARITGQSTRAATS